MNLDEAIEAALRCQPADERVYAEPLAALVSGMPARRRNLATRPRTWLLVAGAGVVAVLAVAALVIYPMGTSGGGGPNFSPTPAASTSLVPQPNGSVRQSSLPSVRLTPSPWPSSLPYTVRPGDNMAKIAAQFNVPLWELELANPTITDPNHIVVGQVLNIPWPGQIAPPPAPPAGP